MLVGEYPYTKESSIVIRLSVFLCVKSSIFSHEVFLEFYFCIVRFRKLSMSWNFRNIESDYLVLFDYSI